MGNGMNKVMPGLYIGNYRDSKDYQQLDRYGITHIVSIHDSPRRFHPDKHYLCVIAADKPDQNLSQYFSVCNDFIHSARLKQGNVLIHCLAGMSRSVTVAVAYIMCVTPLSWKEALKVVRAGRSIANPNLGFQNQLQDFETNKLIEERRRLKERFPSLALELTDKEQCYLALDYYEELLESKGVCEGHCKFGKDCPTGICRTDSRGGIRPSRKPSLSSKKQYNTSLSTSPSTSSQLSVRSAGNPASGGGGGAQSCPTSPRCSKALSQRQGSGGAATRHPDNPRAAGEYAAEIDLGEISELRRSSSIVSTFRPRSSPAGLYSYTGSAPPSVHGSRVDLSVSGGTGSAIYLGASGSGSSGATGGSGATSGSAGNSPGPGRRLSMRSTPKSTPRSTPESSPKVSPKKSASSRSLASSTATASPKKSVSGSGRTATVTPVTTSTPPSSNSGPPRKEPADKPTGKLTSKTTVPGSGANASAATTTTTTSSSSSVPSRACTATRTPSIVIDITTTTATITTGVTSSGKDAAYGRSDEKRDTTSKDKTKPGASTTNTSSKAVIANNNANSRALKKE
uniref:Dual specificity protein phosphatase 15 n=1 Tax=Anopheles coluzzii TaxID=1518534 RepID=A0A8W7P5Q4_ANOCL